MRGDAGAWAVISPVHDFSSCFNEQTPMVDTLKYHQFMTSIVIFFFIMVLIVCKSGRLQFLSVFCSCMMVLSFIFVIHTIQVYLKDQTLHVFKWGATLKMKASENMSICKLRYVVCVNTTQRQRHQTASNRLTTAYRLLTKSAWRCQ